MDVSFDVEEVVEAPARELFAFLIDHRNLPSWDPRVVEVDREDPGPLRVGSRIREVRQVGPRRVGQVVQVSRLEPPHHFDLRVVSGAVPLHADFVLRAEDEDRTVLRLHAHGTAPGPGVLAPVLAKVGRRQFGEHLKRLREAVESGSVSPPPSSAAPPSGRASAP